MSKKKKNGHQHFLAFIYPPYRITNFSTQKQAQKFRVNKKKNYHVLKIGVRAIHPLLNPPLMLCP